MGNKSKAHFAIPFGNPTEGEVTVTGVDFDKHGNLIPNANATEQKNHQKIEDSKKSNKWNDGDRAKLNKDNIGDLDYLEDSVNKAGFVIDNIRDNYNHNNVTLHHPDNPNMKVVVDKLAIESILSSTGGFDADLGNILTKINESISSNDTAKSQIDTVRVQRVFNNSYDVKKGKYNGDSTLDLNLGNFGNTDEASLFQNIDEYMNSL